MSKRDCYNCGGEGIRQEGEPCPACHGTGKVEVKGREVKTRSEELREMIGRLPCGSSEFAAAVRELNEIEEGAWSRIAAEVRQRGGRVS